MNCLMQTEREVLALLSRLDLQHIHFMDSPPGKLTLIKSLNVPNGCSLYTYFVLVSSRKILTLGKIPSH